ncbi:MAG: exopolyphosphatase [Pseudohongiellaceae bacterium]|jgi:exopolyphosphatase / guanosine-5'-triphosphate,3'-diphosphate pyrophosphatase
MAIKLDSPYFAAVDLGSNSFHLLIARVQNDRVEIIDREKEMVQLARGIKADGHLEMDAQNRALACLARFAERLRDIPREQVRVVGTLTFRTIGQSKQFIKAAEAALCLPIQIISGFEEARLIYSGLAHSVTNDHNHRLVVDIGGGSTEIIIGKDYEPLCLESLSMGCVTFSELYFSKTNRISAVKLNRAYVSACTEIESIRKNYMKTSWKIAFGTSGTIRTIADLVQSRDGGAVISSGSLAWLYAEILSNKSVLLNVPEPRRSVLPAGIAILKALFDQLKLDSIHVGDAALKEGLLYDIIGRLSDHDSRADTVISLQRKYHVDIDQAERVANTALYFWKNIDGPSLPRVSRTKILAWAAQLHEIGMSVSHSSHHHHGYYILRFSDLAGFGRYEQYILANLVRSQRKGLYDKKFEEMDEQTMTALIPLVVCLRLAVLLHRRREDVDTLPKLSLQGKDFKLKFLRKWLTEHPLTSAGLDQERLYYDNYGISFTYS